MPAALDYTDIDRAILANPTLSSVQLQRLGVKASASTICVRKSILGVPGAKAVRKNQAPDLGEDETLKPTRCKCPKCEVEFTVPMFWTGRGMPRKRCPDCQAKPYDIWTPHSNDCYASSVTSVLHMQGL